MISRRGFLVMGTVLFACACGSSGGRRARLGTWWPGNGGAGKGREGAEAVDVD